MAESHAEKDPTVQQQQQEEEEEEEDDEGLCTAEQVVVLSSSSSSSCSSSCSGACGASRSAAVSAAAAASVVSTQHSLFRALEFYCPAVARDGRQLQYHSAAEQVLILPSLPDSAFGDRPEAEEQEEDRREGDPEDAGLPEERVHAEVCRAARAALLDNVKGRKRGKRAGMDSTARKRQRRKSGAETQDEAAASKDESEEDEGDELESTLTLEEAVEDVPELRHAVYGCVREAWITLSLDTLSKLLQQCVTSHGRGQCTSLAMFLLCQLLPYRVRGLRKPRRAPWLNLAKACIDIWRPHSEELKQRLRTFNFRENMTEVVAAEIEPVVVAYAREVQKVDAAECTAADAAATAAAAAATAAVVNAEVEDLNATSTEGSPVPLLEVAPRRNDHDSDDDADDDEDGHDLGYTPYSSQWSVPSPWLMWGSDAPPPHQPTSSSVG